LTSAAPITANLSAEVKVDAGPGMTPNAAASTSPPMLALPPARFETPSMEGEMESEPDTKLPIGAQSAGTALPGMVTTPADNIPPIPKVSKDEEEKKRQLKELELKLLFEEISQEEYEAAVAKIKG
jgi:hypothetical protein